MNKNIIKKQIGNIQLSYPFELVIDYIKYEFEAGILEFSLNGIGNQKFDKD